MGNTREIPNRHVGSQPSQFDLLAQSPLEADWKLFSGGMRNPYVPPFSSMLYVRDVTRTPFASPVD